MILGSEMKKTMFVKDAVPFQDFGDFFKEFLCLNHAVPFLDFEYFFKKIEARIMRYHLTVLVIFGSKLRDESCGTFLPFPLF